MKKLLLIILLSIALFFTSQSQGLNSVTIGAGISSFPIETYSSSNIGFSCNFSINKVYFDLASNFAAGEGEELKYSTSQTYLTNKLSVGVINVGYIITSKKASIIPYIGYGWNSSIYQDNLGFSSYYYGAARNKFNFGIIGKILVYKQMSIYAGVGNYERFKAGLSFQLIEQ